MKPTDLISLAEAAERLGLSERTVRRYIADGTITAYRLGRRSVRVDPQSLDNMFHPLTVTSADFDFPGGAA